MTGQTPRDGVHAMLPREKMNPHARRLRDTYAITPGIRLVRREFGFHCLEEWYQQGLDPNADRAEVFHYDPPGAFGLGHLGWCEAAFDPPFDQKVIEERGDHELIQDFAGRRLLVFTGRRSGFMPEYVDHPVKDMKTWQENCKWRLDPDSPARFSYLEDEAAKAVAAGRITSIAMTVAGTCHGVSASEAGSRPKSGGNINATIRNTLPAGPSQEIERKLLAKNNL